MLEKNFDLTSYEQLGSDLQQIKAFEIPELDAHVVVMLNGQFSKNLSNISNSDILIQELDENQHAEYLAKHAEYQNDALVAWNTAAWSGGVFIQIPEKKVVTKPILIYHINDTTPGEVKSITRNLVVVGKNSEVTLVEKFDSIGTNPNFSNLVTEIIVAENAGLNFYNVQADHGNRYQFGLKLRSRKLTTAG
jgi:Fe-S cluster assembly protein SufD